MGKRVLVVDHNPDAVESLAVLLLFHGHEVATATTGPEAMLAAASFQPSVALIGLDLSGFDGYELARRLRSQSRDGVLLVTITGHAGDGVKQAARKAGFDHHLLKPADPTAILALLL